MVREVEWGDQQTEKFRFQNTSKMGGLKVRIQIKLLVLYPTLQFKGYSNSFLQGSSRMV